MAHPLNRPVYDTAKGRIVAGYAILQPRVSISLTSAGQSRFAKLFAGEAGIDPYTREVSDAYQDIFGEGSFIGKGLYDVDAFRLAVDGRFPENRILSHDLLESGYARSALVTDVDLIEEHPASYAMTDSAETLAERVERRQPPRHLPERLETTPRQAVEPVRALPARERIFENGLGGFTPDGREYVITLEPGQATPAPWSHRQRAEHQLSPPAGTILTPAPAMTFPSPLPEFWAFSTMAKNIVQFQKGMSEDAFESQFGTEEKCWAHLVQWRWPEGFVCPICGGSKYSLFILGRRRLFQCTQCRTQTSVTAGTIFASPNFLSRSGSAPFTILHRAKAVFPVSN